MADALTRGVAEGQLYGDGSGDQSTFRERRVWYDQHDREWTGIAEKRTGHPVGSLSLQQKTPSGSAPPWEPPGGMEYLVISKDDPTAINIDYDRLLTERLQAREEWNQA